MHSLPVEGLRLRELVFSGCGKDSEVAIGAEGAPRVVIPLSAARLQLTIACELTVRSSAWDDMTVQWRVEPRADQHVVIECAAVDYPGSEPQWVAELAGFASGSRRWEIGWVVGNLVVRLAAAPATP